jgi:hypothetical protein
MLPKKTIRLYIISFIILFLPVYSCQIFAQSRTYRLKAFTDINRAPWKDSIYWFPKFLEGNMLMANGFSPDVKIKINYNLYWERIEIINEHNDTVRLNNSREIKLLNAGGYVFFNDKKKGFTQILIPGDVSLAISCKLNMIIETSSGERFKSQDFYRNSISRFDRLYQRHFSYFFLDKNSRLRKVNKSILLKLMSPHKTQVKQYLVEKPVNFKDQRDLIRLLTFCNSFS